MAPRVELMTTLSPATVSVAGICNDPICSRVQPHTPLALSSCFFPNILSQSLLHGDTSLNTYGGQTPPRGEHSFSGLENESPKAVQMPCRLNGNQGEDVYPVIPFQAVPGTLANQAFKYIQS